LAFGTSLMLKIIKLLLHLDAFSNAGDTEIASQVQDALNYGLCSRICADVAQE
jgi:hypothetical protein